MSTPDFHKIPDMNSYFPTIPSLLIEPIKCCQPNGNQIYSSIYSVGQVFHFLTEGIADQFLTGIEDWSFWLVLGIVLPWVFFVIVIFIILMVTGVLTPWSGVPLIIFAIVVAGLSVYLVGTNASESFTNIYNNAVNTFNTRWTDNEEVIGFYLIDSYNIMNSATKNEQYVCCGFDYEARCVDCQTQLTVSPDTVLSPDRVTLTINIISPPAAGTINIPPQLNGGITGTSIDFIGNESQSFNFIAEVVSTGTTVNVTADMTLEGVGPITISSPVTIIEDPFPPPDVMENKELSPFTFGRSSKVKEKPKEIAFYQRKCRRCGIN